MRSWSRTLVLIASSWLLTACTESNAGNQPQAEPDDPVPAGHARIQLLETEEAEDYREHRWRIELDPALATCKWHLQGSGATSAPVPSNPLTSHEPFEIVYREHKISGTQVVEGAERLGGEAAKQALLEAAPGIEETSAYRCSVEFDYGSASTKTELDPLRGSVVQGSPRLFARGWYGSSEPHSAPAGKQLILTHVIAIQGESGQEINHWNRAGTPFVSIDGKMTPVKELLKTGEHPGWSLWIQFDTAEDDASKDPK